MYLTKYFSIDGIRNSINNNNQISDPVRRQAHCRSVLARRLSKQQRADEETSCITPTKEMPAKPTVVYHLTLYVTVKTKNSEDIRLIHCL